MDRSLLNNIIVDVKKNKIEQIGDDIIDRLEKLKVFHLVMEFSIMCGVVNNSRFNAIVRWFENKFEVVWTKFVNNDFNKTFCDPFLLAISENNPDDGSIRIFFEKMDKILLLSDYGNVSDGYLSIQQCFRNKRSKYDEEEDMVRKIYQMLK